MASTRKGHGEYKCTLSEKSLAKAKKELNENPETRLKSIQALREKAEKYPGLNSRLDNDFLIRFLRTKKFDCERAFQCLLKHYQTRQEDPEIFKNYLPSRAKPVLEQGIQAPLKLHDDQGRQIFCFRLGRWDPEKCSIEDVFRTNMLTLDKLIEDEETQVNGLVFINDATGMGWEQAKNFSPTLAKRGAQNIQEAMPLRLKAIHFFNEPTFIGYIWSMMRPFLKEKTVNRVHFHGPSVESLHQHINPDYLPIEYGGKLPPADAESWKETLLASEQTFIENNKYGYEPPRAGYNPQAGDAMDVLPGTFKKLNVD